MFVVVIQRIHDREGFQSAKTKALAAGFPEGVALPVHAVSRDQQLGIAVWEGESVTAVRDVVERLIGRFADNEYYEMDVVGVQPRNPCTT